MTLSRRGFYAILDLDACGSRSPVDVCAELVHAEPVAVQIRGKRASARAIFDITRALRPHVSCPLIVNDRLDVALVADADGVHLGQDDLPLSEALAVVAARWPPRGFSIGISTHDVAQAVAAARGGASLIGFGPVFPTTTKDEDDPVQGLDRLCEAVRAVEIPVVAIGGISPENVASVAATGCAAATAIAAVLRAPDISSAALRIASAFSKASAR